MSSMTLSKWGNCLAIRIPKKVVDGTNWKSGDQLEYDFSDGELTIRKIRNIKKYDVAELLDGIENAPREEIDWGAPQGREVW